MENRAPGPYQHFFPLPALTMPTSVPLQHRSWLHTWFYATWSTHTANLHSLIVTCIRAITVHTQLTTAVLYCVLKLCTVISTLRWAVLTVLWIGFCHTGTILLSVDLFVFICVNFVCFCFTLHSCCITVSMVGWTWCPILRTYLLSVLWHFG